MSYQNNFQELMNGFSVIKEISYEIDGVVQFRKTGEALSKEQLSIDLYDYNYQKNLDNGIYEEWMDKVTDFMDEEDKKDHYKYVEECLKKHEERESKKRELEKDHTTEEQIKKKQKNNE